jgi:hypothetical protein
VAAFFRVIEKKSEQTSIGEVVERLTHKHPTVSPLTVAEVVRHAPGGDAKGNAFVSAHVDLVARYGTAMPYSSADEKQAEYFVRLLDDQLAELRAKLNDQRRALVRYEHIGDVSGVRRKRRIIKALDRDARSIHRMRNALRFRLSERLQPQS